MLVDYERKRFPYATLLYRERKQSAIPAIERANPDRTPNDKKKSPHRKSLPMQAFPCDT